MSKQTIKKSVTINAPGEKVWNVLTDDQLNRRWYEVFSEGTYADTDWKEGSKAVFQDGSQSGLIGTVVTNKPNQLLSLEYTGMLFNGKEDYESNMAKSVIGGKETYQLIQEDGRTRLDVECDMSEEMFQSMNLAWDDAMKRIKSLAEEN